MGRFFSDRVETALKDIYYDLAAGRGQEGFQLLQEAAQEGDADACCLLARCLYGPEYTCPATISPWTAGRETSSCAAQWRRVAPSGRCCPCVAG